MWGSLTQKEKKLSSLCKREKIFAHRSPLPHRQEAAPDINVKPEKGRKKRRKEGINEGKKESKTRYRIFF